MNLTDIVALAKQGYKPADIKELMALAEPQAEPEPEKEPEVKPEAVKHENEPDKEPANIYEQKIADLEAKAKELEFKLAAAQKANISQNVGADQKNDEDLFSDIATAFM